MNPPPIPPSGPGGGAVVPLADRPLARAMFHDLLAHLVVSDPAREALVRLWRQPWRRYHGAGHAGLLWLRHLAFGGDSADAVTAHAIAYHDAIYDVGAADNETRSAALWREHAAALPDGLRDAVERAIMATADHAARHTDPDAQWLVDLDLTPLGEDWPLFVANSMALRAETGWTEASTSPNAIPPAQQVFLSRLLALPVLYRSPRAALALAPAHEAAARRNLSRWLS